MSRVGGVVFALGDRYTPHTNIHRTAACGANPPSATQVSLLLADTVLVGAFASEPPEVPTKRC